LLELVLLAELDRFDPALLEVLVLVAVVLVVVVLVAHVTTLC
jgi:hypothetical protein